MFLPPRFSILGYGFEDGSKLENIGSRIDTQIHAGNSSTRP